jgi:hypothetical protein
MAITLSEQNTGIIMKTSKVISGLALLPFLAGVAFAQPNQPAPVAASLTNQMSPAVPASSQAASTKHKPQVLADAQMDRVAAGAIGLDDVAVILLAYAIGKGLDKAIDSGLFAPLNFCRASGGKFGC